MLIQFNYIYVIIAQIQDGRCGHKPHRRRGEGSRRTSFGLFRETGIRARSHAQVFEQGYLRRPCRYDGERYAPHAGGCRRYCGRHAPVGAGARCRPLYPLVPAPDGRYGREARCVCRPGRLGRGSGGVLRQTARPAGARCVVVPQRRHPQYVRGSRLFGLGSDLAGLHRRHDALYPDRLHRLYGRGARLQGAAAALDLGGEQGRDRGVPLFRQKRAAGHLVSGLGAGVFPRGRKPLGRTSRPDAHRAYADGA